MILTNEHQHAAVEYPPSLPHLPVPHFLHPLIEVSQQLLTPQRREEIGSLMKQRQEKVYLSYSLDANSYLAHMLGNAEAETQNTVGGLVAQRQLSVASRIEQQGVRQKRASLAQLRSELEGKLAELTGVLDEAGKSEESYANYREFRKNGYWSLSSAKTENVKQFLKGMRHNKAMHHQRYESSLMRQSAEVQNQAKRDRQEREEAKQREYRKQLERQGQQREQRKRERQMGNEKKKEISRFLAKYRVDKPVFVRNEEKFRKEFMEPIEEERRKKMEAIREAHQPLDPEDIEAHIQRYEEYKESLLEETKSQQQKHSQLQQKAEEELKELYHGKYHEQIEPRFSSDDRQQRVLYKKKIQEYSRGVLEKFKPTVDPAKRALMQQSIRDIEMSENKHKNKVVADDGSVTYEDKPGLDRRSIGIGYLQQLKKEHQGLPRKDPNSHSVSQSLVEMSQSKKIDYLRDNKPKMNLKATLSSWRKIIQKKDMTPKDKFQSVMDHVSAMEQRAHLKEAMLHSLKKQDRSLEMKEELDKYYLQSVAAKMGILKDVILKQ